MQRINILEIITGLDKGGAERLLVLTAGNLNPRKYKVIVCCLKNEGWAAEQIRKRGIKVINIDMKGIWDIRAIFRLRAVMKKEAIALVHTHITRADVIGLISAKLAGVPVIISTRHNTFESWQRWYLFRKFYRYLTVFFNAIIAVSEAVKADLINKGMVFTPKKVTVIHNGVDLTEFCPLEDRRIGEVRGIERDKPDKSAIDKKQELRMMLGIESAALIVGTIGRLDCLKGHKYLLEAIPKVLEQLPQTVFLIVGDGPEKSALVKLSLRLDISKKVIFSGWREDIPEMLSILDLCVFPALKEGLGMAVLEAMAMAKPVVANNVDGISEVIMDKKTGVLVPAGDVSQLAEAIIFLLKDKEKSTEMGAAARERIKECFSLERMLINTELLLERLV